ncbi:protein maelstrom homolog [Diachasma alloeum]|uniref:protein maelstrom homolog n=1 Tax=Diachasma alloeum TaxID=454923 RepID=UPI0007381B22|nr:protein maelstrom homolog [Diachasma alloeum]
MPPKKAQKGRNGFWYFMQDFKKTQEHHGRVFPGGFKDIQADPECSKAWKKLSEDEKNRYNTMADKEKGQPRLTGWGEPISLVLERQRKHQEFGAIMKADIDETIRLAQACDNIPDLTVYFIHVNYSYCKDRPDTTVDYIPIEFAICQFSIADGIKNVYHEIVKVKVELGFARVAIEHADNTHKIPENYEQGEDDYKKMYEKFRGFLKPMEDQTGKLPPIYTRQKFVTTVTCFLDRLTAGGDVPDDTFTLYSLECLFGKLMVLCNPEVDRFCNPILLAESEFEKDSFAYFPNLECEYHQKIEGTSIHCSFSIIRQWAFVICDYCCNWFGVEMLPNIHRPDIPSTEDEEVNFLATSIASIRVEKEFKPSNLKSMTGVSEAYRYEKAGRTAREEAQRRKDAFLNPLEIIDHSKPVDKSLKYFRPLRPPNTVMGHGEVPPQVVTQTKPRTGRGRGGIAYD